VADDTSRQSASAMAIREAGVADGPEVARLLHDFNSEFSEPTPGVAFLTERTRRLLADQEITVLLSGERPHGLAVLRFRPSLWTPTLDAYLEEFYVAPERRGRGIGRALLQAAIDAARERGAAHIDLTTSEDDTTARGLYDRAGFTDRERGPDGPIMLYYERDL
jgi:ribosomal protein S18 acetylase RimI-like enzyme